MKQFPSNFLWGISSSAYQIEGAAAEDGRLPSIWDDFSHQPHKTFQGDTGDTACDHYRHYQQDIDWMKKLGLLVYRFSFSWPRILPTGAGAINPIGINFYDRLVDSLLANDIQPFVTLYHWDLPLALEQSGGWLNRDTASRFADYAQTVVRHFRGRINMWATLNEPRCSALQGYFSGEHAPGHQDETFGEANRALHHLFLGHGLAVAAVRAEHSHEQIGILLNNYPIYPASPSEADRAAVYRFDRFHNDWFSDPVLLGVYPTDLMPLFGQAAPPIQTGDMEIISTPLDFLGINYYSRFVVADDPETKNPLKIKFVRVEDASYTDMDNEIYPTGLYDILKQTVQKYHPARILITENGCAVQDSPDAAGRVHDTARVDFLSAHLQELWRAISDGVLVDGYFIWSLLDNFEWSFGYSKRFGIIHVDYATQARTPKDSFFYYQNIIRNNGLAEDIID
jgi:beta-glucosidase